MSLSSVVSSLLSPRCSRLHELSFTNRAEPIAVEVDLPADSSMIIQVEQEIANGPALEGDYEGTQVCVIFGVNSNDLRRFKMTRPKEIPGRFFAGKCERTSPRLLLFLVGDYCAVGVY